MAAAQIVGDPACSLSASGVPNMALVPAGVTSVGVGTVGNYTCLIW